MDRAHGEERRTRRAQRRHVEQALRAHALRSARRLAATSRPGIGHHSSTATSAGSSFQRFRQNASSGASSQYGVHRRTSCMARGLRRFGR